MLRLPRFSVEAPDTIERVCELLSTPGARLISGGTDLLPNLKHRFESPPLLVSTGKLRELQAVSLSSEHLLIGAGVTLSELAENASVRKHASSLADAASRVASPLIRNSATIGGNVNLDTRCRYVNQTEFWRSAIGGCLKSTGDVCHVVPGGKSCVAAMSADCVPVLLTLDAVLVQHSVRGERLVPIADHYTADGIRHLSAPTDEITTAIRIPSPKRRRVLAYAKWAVRESIDFPLISVAMRFDLKDEAIGSIIEAAHIAVGVLAAKPKSLRTKTLVDMRLGDADFYEALSSLLFRQAKPLPNVPYEAEYRRRVIPVFAVRALKAALS